MTEEAIHEACARGTVTVPTPDLVSLCIEAKRHAILIDRIAKITEHVPDYPTSLDYRFSGFMEIKRLITEAKAGNWPKENE